MEFAWLNVARLYDLAALGTAMIAIGAILATPDVAPAERAAAMVAVAGALLVVGSMRRRDRR